MKATFEDHPTDPDKVILRKKPRIDQGPDYERGFIDGMQYQMQSSVDKAVNRMAQPEQEPKCNPHPKAPHGFNRNASHANDRYTCECESWDAYEAGRLDGIAQEQAMYEVQRLGQEIQPEQEPVANYCKECLTYNGHQEGCSHYTTPPQRTYDNMLKAIDSMRPAARVIKDKPATWWLDEFEKVVRNLKENNT